MIDLPFSEIYIKLILLFSNLKLKSYISKTNLLKIKSKPLGKYLLIIITVFLLTLTTPERNEATRNVQIPSNSTFIRLVFHMQLKLC